MAFQFTAPWHKASFDRFLSAGLPELLAARLPLAGYQVEPESAHTCRITVELAVNSHTISLAYPALPKTDDQGLFQIGDLPYVVIPLASTEELAQATIQCVGEQLLAYIAARLGQAPAEITWDEPTARAFLPLDGWFEDFLRGAAQPLDTTNWSSRTTHLRRLLIPNRTRVVAPGQLGRVDPFETPEGPYIGRVFTIALGAAIRGDQLVIFDDSPVGGLGHNAALIPFLEHDDANRLLMGVNMMRQGLVPPEAEPALVQTGNEPLEEMNSPELWCGRNLLTAFVAWGEGSAEDGLILSQSAAQRLNYPYPAEPGDKLANRHGTKGVVSQVLPDEQMPHLADGTPVEICFSFTGLHTRLNFGQVREAVMGRIAKAEGRPIIVPSFQAPSMEEIQAGLAQTGLPESGMERLHIGLRGPQMPYPSTVGYIYWYRLAHLARPKFRAIGSGAETAAFHKDENPPHPVLSALENGQVLSEREIGLMLRLGARYNAYEAVVTRAVRWLDSEIGSGQWGLATRNLTDSRPKVSFSPYFQSLARRLAAAGILVELEDGQLHFSLLQFAVEAPVEAPDEPLTLARKLPHPWLPAKNITRVGAPPKEAGEAARQAFIALQRTNDRLTRWLETQPRGQEAETIVEPRQASYMKSLFDQLETRLAAYLDTLLPPESLRLVERQADSARAVIAPGIGLHFDQVGLPEEMARILFTDRVETSGADLDEVLAQSWVIVLREPALSPTSLIAFRPLRVDGPSIRLHPQACTLLNADFDGDQVAVFLPLSPEAQREAGETLSIAAHLARDPELMGQLIPTHEGVWGLAYLSLNPDGRREITLAGFPESRISIPLAQADLADGLRELLTLEGPERALQIANALAHLGYAAASASGASLSPFAGASLDLPPAPSSDDLTVWESYVELCAEEILSEHDYTKSNLGPQLLSAAVRPRSRRFLPVLVGPRGPVTTADGRVVIVRSSLVQGRTPEELYASVAGARLGLAQIAQQSEAMLNEPPGFAIRETGPYMHTTVLARARRSRHPGLVFARAAASSEVDPLTDEETRLLVGLPPGDQR